MSKDVTDMKKWFKDLGMDVYGQVDDNELKKLMPPQRRDLWRNIIMKHVLPTEKVDLIKKSLLLHKLEKRQKPLMTKVESDEDLGYALKYEELTMKYNKIQKEINDAKKQNDKIKTELNEKNELKKTLIHRIESKQNIMYLAKHKTDYYKKFIEELKEKSNICSHFSVESDELLTKSDYEDSLIKCFHEINNAKESDKMNEGVNIGKKLCNAIYTIIREKSPDILLQIFEDVIMDNINKIKTITEELTEVSNQNDDKRVSNDLLIKKQLELKSKITTCMTKKDNAVKNFEETTNLVENEIINKYKLKYISYIDHELLEFKKNVKDDFSTIINISIDCSEINGFQENDGYKNEQFKILDDAIDKINTLNGEINQHTTAACDLLKEFYKIKSDFGIDEVKSIMEELARNYFIKINNDNLINKTIISIKNSSSCDINNINKLTVKSPPKSNVINFRILQDIVKYSETINVIYKFKTKFDEVNKKMSTVDNINYITQKEEVHKTEFNSIITQIENNILEISSRINDCDLITKTLSSEDLLSKN